MSVPISPTPICPVIRMNSTADFPSLLERLASRAAPDADVENTVRAILTDVAARGDAALVEYTRRFDCENFSQDKLPVSINELDAALTSIPEADQAAITEAAANITAFHSEQIQRSSFTTRPDGTILGQMVTPVDRVGLYVPGGRSGETPLISSLLMNAIPAQVAGVKELAVVSPPRKDGSLNPHILATAAILGITEIYRAGSAWAIAALAHGTETIRPVDVIAGPGNLYVATAKRLLQGSVGIDMVAGPSEILVLADESANPAWIAADMLSQAEHDPLAAALCITDSTRLAQAVQSELERQIRSLPREKMARESLADWGGIAIVPDMALAAELSNRVAPEHLELCVQAPWDLLGSIRHAGSIFMGSHSPEPLGDYFAGPNHVLPTLSTARFSSGLSVHTFCKRSNIIAASAAFTNKATSPVARLARLEGLEAHARAIEIRGTQRDDVWK